MESKKKIAFILTVYTDGSRKIDEPDSQVPAQPQTGDSALDSDDGGNNPPPPKDPQ